MKKLQATLLKSTSLLITLLAQSACQAPNTHTTADAAFEEPLPEAVLLYRTQWKIGDLDAETLFFLEDGIPQHSTTVTNNNATDRWWTGLKIYSYGAYGRTPPVNTDPISDEEWERLTDEELSLRIGGGWGTQSGQACRSSSTLPEIKRGTVQMRPGETRSYRDSHSHYPQSPRRENITNWNIKGHASLPSTQPFEEWPPFQINLEFRWDEEGGYSVVAERSDL